MITLALQLTLGARELWVEALSQLQRLPDRNSKSYLAGCFPSARGKFLMLKFKNINGETITRTIEFLLRLPSGDFLSRSRGRTSPAVHLLQHFASQSCVYESVEERAAHIQELQVNEWAVAPIGQAYRTLRPSFWTGGNN